MSVMATLYVRDVPPEIYEEVKRWAEGSGRSVNAEVLALLEREAERRKKNGEWWQSVLDLQSEISLSPNAPRPEDLIREDRDHGH
jgi:hypothetical protein